MPFKSKAQMRKFYAMEASGEMPKGTAKKWSKETKNKKGLPEHVKEAIQRDPFLFSKLAYELFNPSHSPPRSETEIMSEDIQSAKEERTKGMSPVEYRRQQTYKNRNILARNREAVRAV